MLVARGRGPEKWEEEEAKSEGRRCEGLCVACLLSKVRNN